MVSGTKVALRSHLVQWQISPAICTSFSSCSFTFSVPFTASSCKMPLLSEQPSQLELHTGPNPFSHGPPLLCGAGKPCPGPVSGC